MLKYIVKQNSVLLISDFINVFLKVTPNQGM